MEALLFFITFVTFSFCHAISLLSGQRVNICKSYCTNVLGLPNCVINGISVPDQLEGLVFKMHKVFGWPSFTELMDNTESVPFVLVAQPQHAAHLLSLRRSAPSWGWWQPPGWCSTLLTWTSPPSPSLASHCPHWQERLQNHCKFQGRPLQAWTVGGNCLHQEGFQRTWGCWPLAHRGPPAPPPTCQGQGSGQAFDQGGGQQADHQEGHSPGEIGPWSPCHNRLLVLLPCSWCCWRHCGGIF